MAYIPGRKRKKPKDEETESPFRGDIDIEKLKLAYEDLAELHRQVRESHIEMILNLALAAEYKDPDTGNHIMRISDYANEIARGLGLSDPDVEILRYASPMHDIGKIGIPDKILQKPGKLTPEEWEIMKQHTVIGARMFQSARMPLLKSASEIALSHHEKFDGSGYPYGKKGKEIPLFGRIVALVDVFDAIISERCYKSKSTFEEGYEYVQKLSGTHLDPELVEVFLDRKPEFRHLYDANTTIQQFVKDFKETDVVE